MMYVRHALVTYTYKSFIGKAGNSLNLLQMAVLETLASLFQPVRQVPRPVD